MLCPRNFAHGQAWWKGGFDNVTRVPSFWALHVFHPSCIKAVMHQIGGKRQSEQADPPINLSIPIPASRPPASGLMSRLLGLRLLAPLVAVRPPELPPPPSTFCRL